MKKNDMKDVEIRGTEEEMTPPGRGYKDISFNKDNMTFFAGMIRDFDLVFCRVLKHWRQ